MLDVWGYRLVYRRRDHASLSAATTDRYDQAVHLNRKAPFGITEDCALPTLRPRRLVPSPAKGARP